MRRRDQLAQEVEEFLRPLPQPRATNRPGTVVVHVTETHDGDACDCIEKTMTLEVGDEVELTHICHDGRVDKVVARVTAINPPTEHGTAEVRKG